jgi:hypothetical protein
LPKLVLGKCAAIGKILAVDYLWKGWDCDEDGSKSQTMMMITWLLLLVMIMMLLLMKMVTKLLKRVQ